MKSSSRLVLVSFLLFIPDVLALLFLELEPILYAFLLLPVMQIYLYFKLKNNRNKANVAG